MADINISKLFVDGQKKQIASASEVEKTKQGKLRAGNSGMITEKGAIVGPCMSATYLRFQGVELMGLDDDGDSGGAAGRELMFEAGRVNETLWVQVLSQSYDGVILQESEIPTRWVTDSGVEVTGRPDIVLCDADKKPQLGLELKQISSFWTAYEVRFKNQPKYPHLLQAGHYSWQLGVPFEIWYTSRADFHSQAWINKHLPQPGEPGSEPVVYTYFMLDGEGGRKKVAREEYNLLPPKARQAEPMKVGPFIRGFRIQFNEKTGKLGYKPCDTPNANWVETDITQHNIRSYYEAIPLLTHVPPEAAVLKADGSKAGFKNSDYCSLQGLCCKYNQGRNIEEWHAEVKCAVDKKNATRK